jgi:DNA-binding MarR family transcriptional regulator
MTTRSVRTEIKQGRPFRSKGQEGTIALLRTASVVARVIARVLEPWSLSLAQYNALRIIRGSGARGIATLSIRERMIEEGTTITRLLDKLEEGGTHTPRAQRSRSATGHVLRHAQGRQLLDKIDPLIDAADEAAVSALSERQLQQFISAALMTTRSLLNTRPETSVAPARVILGIVILPHASSTLSASSEVTDSAAPSAG